MPPDRGLSNKKQAGLKSVKNRITYAFTVNADGSEKKEPFIIGKAAQPRSFKKKTGAQLGFHYRHNAKAWMTTPLYQDWIRKWDRELKEEGRFILLLQDNFKGHEVPTDPPLSNIRVENFRPNLTSHVQPLDQGIIRCFKAHYRSEFISRSIENYERGVTPADIYKLNILEAMRMAADAWYDVKPQTIANCWRKAGILPTATTAVPTESESRSRPSNVAAAPSPPNPADCDIEAAETRLEHEMNTLQGLGVLQKTNRMSLDELLNAAEEQGCGMEEYTPESIFEAVQLAHRATETGKEDELIEEEPPKPRPTRKQALDAASVLRDYIQEVNEPFARKLEQVLASFGCQTRLEATQNMMDGCLDNFFTRKST